MRVTMLQQVSGSRDGQAWPGPGSEVDLPDWEARGLIQGGVAVDAKEKLATVLVPPAGIHTPGAVALGGESPLVEVPVDGVRGYAQTRDALRARSEGNFTRSAGHPQHADGSAATRESLERSVRDEQAARDQYAGTSSRSSESSTSRSSSRS